MFTKHIKLYIKDEFLDVYLKLFMILFECSKNIQKNYRGKSI